MAHSTDALLAMQHQQQHLLHLVQCTANTCDWSTDVVWITKSLIHTPLFTITILDTASIQVRCVIMLKFVGTVL